MDLKRRQNSIEATLRSKKYELNILMFKRLWRVLKIVFPSITSMSSLLIFTLIVAYVISEFVTYYEGLIPSRFYKAFINRDHVKIFQLIFLTLILVIAISVIDSCKSYFMDTIMASWRQSLCNALHRSYFSGLTFYKMNVTNNKLDNSDQRITQDVDKMCRSLIKVLPRTIVCPFILVFYNYQAYKVCGYYSLIAASVCIIVYGIMFIKISSPIVKHTAHVEKCEGDFRYNHTNIRINAEAIAFHRAQQLQLKLINRNLYALLQSIQSVTYRLFPASFCNSFFAFLKSNMAYLVIGISILAGNFQDISAADLTALVAKNHFYLSHSTWIFYDVLSQLSVITELAGTVHRIGECFEEMEILSASDDSEHSNDTELTSGDDLSTSYLKGGELTVTGMSVRESKSDKDDNNESKQLDYISFNSRNDDTTDMIEDSSFCVFDRVTVFPPVNVFDVSDSEPILSEISFRFKLRTNVLVTGDGSCGKTTVLRIIRGLWDISEGKVSRSNLLELGSSAAFFQPQKIIFVEGSLKQQIQFPEQEDTFSVDSENDDRLVRYLHLFCLQKLLNSFGGLEVPVNWTWENILSPNEAQRIALVRILYHRPTVLVMDDIFNGLESCHIESFYHECKQLDITVISVGDINTLARFHDEMLILQY